MWNSFNIFGWNKKKPNLQPVQREVSVTLTNGDRRETIQRSPTGTKLATSSTKHGLDDDNSSEASTSLNFGFKTGGFSSPRRTSSFSFSREPLDLPTWSNVTSPGFTSRLVQQASGSSPLKEFNDSISHSPFRKSPYRDLTLGELPFVGFSRKPSPPAFPSPQRTASLRSGVSSSVYNRDRRRNARHGQAFVRIAPIDPSVKANVSISRKSSSPPLGMGSNGGPYSPRGSPRAASEPYRSEGLGGIPNQELAMRFNRLWPSSPGAPVSGPGRPSSPTSPSNIMEALTVGRKRGREQDTYYPPNATPPSVSPPSKISIGIGDTPVRPQVSKRVKFLGGPDGHDRPMMVGYSSLGAGDSEPLSSESILEQMNQTEKRFLPDSTSTPYNIQKKNIRMPGSDDQPSALHSALRKRRSQTSVMSAIEDEPRGEKVGRFCTCNECYAEAAGISVTYSDASFNKDGSTSPRSSDEKSTNTGESAKSKETCDKGVSTIDNDRGAYFREVFRKADKKKPSKDEEIDELMPYGKTVITKEMYEKDKRKRIERYYRILKLKPPGGSIFDPCPGNNTSASVASTTSSNINNETTVPSIPVNPIINTPATTEFSFGSRPPTTDVFDGPAAVKPTSPVAITVTTSACTTITSPSSTPSAFGSNGLSSTAPASTIPAFGISGSVPSPIVSSAVSPSVGTPFGNAAKSPPSQISFSKGGSDPLPKSTTTEPSGNAPTPATTNTGTTGGFSFGPSSTVSAATTTSVPTFGLGAPSLTTAPAPTTGGFNFSASTTSSAVTTAPTPSFGLGATTSTANTTTTLGTSGSSSSTPSFGGFGGGGGGFGKSTPFGSPTTSSSPFQISFASVSNPLAKPKTTESTGNIAVPSTTNTGTAGAFSFGSSSAASAASTTSTPAFGLGSAPTTQATGGFNFGSSLTSSAVPTTSPPAFGLSTPAPTATPTTAAITAGNSATSPPSFGGFGGGSSFGKGTTFGNPASSSSPFQISFGGGSDLSSKPKAVDSIGNTAAPSTTNTGIPGGFNFGSSITASAATTTSAPAFGGLGSSAPTASQTTGGFSFGSSSTQSSVTTASTPAFGMSAPTAIQSPGGFNFGSSSTPSALTTTPTPAFGLGASTATANTTTALGTSGSSTPAPSFGGFGGGGGFGKPFNPACASNSWTPATAAPAPATISSPFGFGGSNNNQTGTTSAATPVFGQSPSGNSFSVGTPAASAPFQFGQQAAQGVQPGGFNFAANAPAPSPGGTPMFSMGSTSTAPRRRDVRRRHR